MNRRSNTDVESFCMQYGIHLPSKTILVSGEIDEGSKNTILLARKVLDAENATITVELDTSGGDLYQALAIYDCLRAFKGRVEIVGFGKVWSAGVLIMQAADEGGRLLMPNCTVMLHQGYSESPMDHPESIQRFAREDKRVRARINHIVYSAMKIRQKEFLESYKFDVYLDSFQAVSRGLADRIITPI